MSEWHKHVQAPEDPEDGDEIRCPCGYVAVFVVLDDGLPGEWGGNVGETLTGVMNYRRVVHDVRSILHEG